MFFPRSTARLFTYKIINPFQEKKRGIFSTLLEFLPYFECYPIQGD